MWELRINRTSHLTDSLQPYGTDIPPLPSSQKQAYMTADHVLAIKTVVTTYTFFGETFNFVRAYVTMTPKSQGLICQSHDKSSV